MKPAETELTSPASAVATTTTTTTTQPHSRQLHTLKNSLLFKITIETANQMKLFTWQNRYRDAALFGNMASVGRRHDAAGRRQNRELIPAGGAAAGRVQIQQCLLASVQQRRAPVRRGAHVRPRVVDGAGARQVGRVRVHGERRRRLRHAVEERRRRGLPGGRRRRARLGGLVGGWRRVGGGRLHVRDGQSGLDLVRTPDALHARLDPVGEGRNGQLPPGVLGGSLDGGGQQRLASVPKPRFVHGDDVVVVRQRWVAERLLYDN